MAATRKTAGFVSPKVSPYKSIIDYNPGLGLGCVNTLNIVVRGKSGGEILAT